MIRLRGGYMNGWPTAVLASKPERAASSFRTTPTSSAAPFAHSRPKNRVSIHVQRLRRIRPMSFRKSLLQYLARYVHPDLERANAELLAIIAKIEEDLRLAQSIQRRLIPEKFDQVPGMKVMHRYLRA